MASLQDSLKDLLLNSSIPPGALSDMWRTYLDENTTADLSGVQLDDAEKLFLLEQLGLESSTRALRDLWMAYFVQQGYTAPSFQQAFKEWIEGGGAVVVLEDWILLTGVWNDDGEWDDSATWNDGV